MASSLHAFTTAATPSAAPRHASACRHRAGRVACVRVRASQQESNAVKLYPSRIIVKHDMTKEQLEKKGVFSWPTWGCEVSKFDWSYDQNEDAYILSGRVEVEVEGGEKVTLQAGDMATLPVGMSCVWDVKEPIKKHYRLH